MSIFSKIFGGLKWFAKLFSSSIAKDALETADSLLPQVLPIVKEIQSFVPNVGNATIYDIVRVYEAFGETLGKIEENPIAFGSALSNLALIVAQKQLARVNKPSVANRLINFAIQAALVALKAK